MSKDYICADTVEVSVASDYAVMTIDGGRLKFYYGYERTWCQEHGNDSQCDCGTSWCFTVERSGTEVARMIHEDLGCSDMFDVQKNLLLGIGYHFLFPTNEKLQSQE